MLFNSLHFFVFAIIVIPVFFVLPHKKQKYLLLFASIYFYSSLKLAFLPLIMFSFTATWLFTLYIKQQNKRTDRMFLFLTLLVNLGILFFFKYTDFVRSSVYDIESMLGLDPPPFQAIGFILPLGISFYTFQAIAYAVDVYRGEIKAEKNYADFFLFLLFFPQLVAGPIMRASQLIPQFASRKTFNKTMFISGMSLVVLGIFKKTIIADPVADLIDPVFANPGIYSSSTLFIADVFFSFQIYCDFSGYSDIAIGTGQILGFHIPINFHRPYFSSSITELWQRWHISLSTWLKDYVYIPLGGNRVSRLRNYINVFLTMIIGGIWHGAAWTFVIWGGMHAVLLNLERLFLEKKWNRAVTHTPIGIKIFLTFLLFVAGAHFFRSNTVENAFLAGKKILFFENGISADLFKNLNVVIPVLMLFLLEFTDEFYPEKFRQLKESPLRYSFMASVILIAFMIYTVTVSPKFYYFQF